MNKLMPFSAIFLHRQLLTMKKNKKTILTFFIFDLFGYFKNINLNFFNHHTGTLTAKGVAGRRRGGIRYSGNNLSLKKSQLGKASLKLSFLLTLVLIVSFSGVNAMTELKDKEMSGVTGQALLQMGKTQGVGISSGTTFYKAGLDAELELNMNIDKLQLGCGGINGFGCDIDIDQLSLTGLDETSNRAASAAILTRPFFEFAIKNDNSKTLREITGIRMSAENTSGLLTLGDQQAGSADPGNSSGINSLSGYMVLGETSGTAQTKRRIMTYDNYTCTAGDACSGTYQGLQRAMTGRIYASLNLYEDTTTFKSTDYGLFLSSADADVTVPSTVVSGKRMQSVNLSGTAEIGQIDFSGRMAANVDGILLGADLELDKDVSGNITGLQAEVPIQQSLKYIHRIVVDSPFSLSMQKSDVLWPGAAVAAQSGWWMAFEDEIDIGNISPEAKVSVTNDVLIQALGPEFADAGTGSNCNTATINCALARRLTGDDPDHGTHGVECNSLRDCLGGALPVGNVNVPNNPSDIVFPLSNLKLSGQNVAPNCFGNARFC